MNLTSPKITTSILAALLGCSLLVSTGAAADDSASCLPVTTVEDLDLATYVSAPWYVQQQAENAYTPPEQNRCVTARYQFRDTDVGYNWWDFGSLWDSIGSWWGYTVDVFNYAEDENGVALGGSLCANYDPDTPSQLWVAPCFLPQWFAGPYWIVAYREGPTDGYALVSGGPPTLPVVSNETDSDSDSCGPRANATCCSTGVGINDSGLWILTRRPNPSGALVDEVRAVAKQLGYATSVLFNVTHDDECEVPGIGEDED
mmetsp:Transcript_25880/g.60916  ORF Transcript_25880/g.60916 Transcript_25880/m.60916 type:complete len:259 (-) Transcript_25880:484-1260(-)